MKHFSPVEVSKEIAKTLELHPAMTLAAPGFEYPHGERFVPKSPRTQRRGGALSTLKEKLHAP